MFAFSRIGKLTLRKLDKKGTLCVWIINQRKLGNLLFVIGQDSTGRIQIVIKKKELICDFKIIKKGDLVKIWGTYKKKEKKHEETVELEIELSSFKLINSSKTLPFDIEDKVNINEDTKYRYRYLDLRRFASRNILFLKNEFLYETRKFFFCRDFKEIETPVLSQYSPEGSECFIVPSSLPKRSYTLTQSPQIFKQLLMMSGFGKYYQISKCFRNEGARSNRQIEFSQLDAEVSFATTKQIQRFIEKFLLHILKIFDHPFDVFFSSLDYDEAVKKYGNDKPDLRINKNKHELQFVWINNYPMFKYNKEKNEYKSLRAPFTMLKKGHVRNFLSGKKKPELVISEGFDLVLNGEEMLSGAQRIYQRELQERVFEVLGYSRERREKYFGYFLEALDFAAPPCVGFGLGLDRFLGALLGIVSLKPLLAFPKNIDGTCSLTGAPDDIDD